MSSNNHNKTDDQQGTGPRHVAIIMDGNGRWAKNQGKLRISGHKAGVKAVRRSVSFAVSNNLEALTLYAFSSENWSRPAQEVTALMELFVWALDSEVKSLHKHNVRLRIIGDVSRFSNRIQERIRRAEELTQQNSGLTLNIAANYGGRWDIIQGVKKLAEQVQEGLLRPDQITEENLSAHLCMQGLAPVDLVIRTGGEHRISNFLLWQIAYAEFYFTDVLWPDFDEHVFEGALNAFSLRERRYGGAAPGGA
ncbi:MULTISPECIES: (2E,6E)-farnesyl-diphosphate-specific ditrans,polycis-undecaprenyl-diphosphate synthase [Pantoea]|jgi:undecaprenyl diphosphate synthase|uniref:Ditrans,polycis-undecaprenyl-diphosphate synthase ((2E,6E)-farnesyl-diphosphate specific) n=1 Tax=Pantoea piersonii TaxID=2364647 RepID=A0AAJ5U9E0_9GAMM|nr:MULTISPECIES: (2E,6E)-farnesyl-diphosphate-specific ditrans,polycis-undecaprenyl-diphosphate synthase [Pantoea]HCW98279.1 (2E,6E)-farnesyl- diphosphate-specific ditrans,polycis-undecaprenyl-diphosphate synthase [Pantoea sp.]MBZ6388067.1 (2E,6E)-farnesyl-diphosphate-specific ditrans,polycis-undecaprenyl-diphosphate synthase [Pantoea piersonii]MBZ6398481.1 (2E,6E)-farnesyl-diphosphate-specific ditrans,polycis-undecaprenyl-diphosphate synthase [Pantoea piersonii]MBZ6407247.1 (2E,6E)-farnesyl-di